MYNDLSKNCKKIDEVHKNSMKVVIYVVLTKNP